LLTWFLQTNYIDRLDSALMRPGRIDRRIRYTLATVAQAQGLYERLFKDAEVDGEAQRGVRDDVASPLVAATPLADLDKPSTSGLSAPLDISPDRAETRVVSGAPATELSAPADSSALAPSPQRISDEQLITLAQQFAAAVRDYEFSPAELQGYLLSNRESPIAAAADMSAWVARQRSEQQEKADLKAQRKERMRAARAKMEAARFHPHQYGPYTPFPPPLPHMGLPPPPGVLPSPLPPSPTPSLPLGQSGDTDVAAVAPDAPLAASTTPAPASPPLVPHATTPPPSHLDNPEPSIPKLVNGINGTS
jgi:chaperone BCS1